MVEELLVKNLEIVRKVEARKEAIDIQFRDFD